MPKCSSQSDHRVAAEHPRSDPVAVLVGTVPEPRSGGRERVADRRLHLPRVAGQQQLHLARELAGGDHVVPVPGRVRGADDEHPGLAEQQQRVAALAGQRVGLDPPPIGGEPGEPALELPTASSRRRRKSTYRHRGSSVSCGQAYCQRRSRLGRRGGGVWPCGRERFGDPPRCRWRRRARLPRSPADAAGRHNAAR